MKQQLARLPALGWAGSVFSLFLLLASCTAELTKYYDAALVSGLNAANEEALVFFSEISAGASKARFAELAPKYDSLIGKFEALKLQSAARPTPTLGILLGSKLPGCGSAGECLESSGFALAEIVGTFEGMKDDNRKLGLTAAAVQINKRSYQNAIEQVLVIENALGS